MKSNKTSDDLFDEIHDNVKKDRGSLETFYQRLLVLINNGDPELMVNASDGVAKLAAELTRNNQQLVEIAKLKLKKDLVNLAEAGIAESDREDLFEELGESLGDN